MSDMIFNPPDIYVNIVEEQAFRILNDDYDHEDINASEIADKITHYVIEEKAFSISEWIESINENRSRKVDTICFFDWIEKIENNENARDWRFWMNYAVEKEFAEKSQIHDVMKWAIFLNAAIGDWRNFAENMLSQFFYHQRLKRGLPVPEIDESSIEGFLEHMSKLEKTLIQNLARRQAQKEAEEQQNNRINDLLNGEKSVTISADDEEGLEKLAEIEAEFEKMGVKSQSLADLLGDKSLEEAIEEERKNNES